MIHEDENVRLYMSPVRSIIHVKEWAEQRPLNEEHIRNLVKSLSNKKDIVGSFKIIIDIENRTRIIDGNHRVNALRRIMKKDNLFNMNALIELRKVRSIDSEEAIALFKDANNVLNVSPDDMPNVIAYNVVHKLIKEFSGMIRDCKDKRINRPYIDKKILYNKLKNLLQDSEITESKLLRNIRKINSDLGLKKRTELDVTEKMFLTACENGFYLGLVKDLKWLNSNLLK